LLPRLIAAAVTAAAVARHAAVPRAPRPDRDQEEQLKAVGEELEQEQLDVERLQQQEVSLLDAIDAAENAQVQAERQAELAEKRRANLAAELEAARERERAAQAEADERLRRLSPRLRLWQRLSPDRQAGLLLGSTSAQQALERRRLFRSLLGGELSEVRLVQKAVEAARADRADALAFAAELPSKERDARTTRAEARDRKAKHAALLAAIHDERNLHEKAMVELQQAQSKLSTTLASLSPKKSQGTDFAQQKGRLPRPVEGPIEVGFGQILNPKFNTVTLQKGIDIRAPEGSPVRAQHAGRVVHAGWFQGYGNLVILDHGDGYYTLFAHLADIDRQLGDAVAAGDQLGTVGATGSLKGPYLYYEIRRHGQALDPSTWMLP
jgi:septal ring factor EnvC (AmiA/AmiB activator)